MSSLNTHLTEPENLSDITSIFRNQRFVLQLPGSVTSANLEQNNAYLMYDNYPANPDAIWCNVRLYDGDDTKLIMFPEMLLESGKKITLYTSDIKYDVDGTEYESEPYYKHFLVTSTIGSYDDDLDPGAGLEDDLYDEDEDEDTTSTDLQLLITRPAHQYSNVPLDSIIYLIFNKDIDSTIDLDDYMDIYVRHSIGDIDIPSEATNLVATIEDNVITITPTEDMEYNREITVYFHDKGSGLLPADDGTVLDEATTYWFTTYYYPTFTTPSQVRITEGIGVYLTDVIDDLIWRTILKNSIYATRYWASGSKRLTISGVIPWCVAEYTLYATVLDLYSHVMLNLATSGGSKVLGDLKITDNGAGSFQGPLGDWRRHLISIVDQGILNLKNECKMCVPVTGVRGNTSGEIRPIIDYQYTWKRYPKIDKIGQLWASMYPNSQPGKDLTGWEEAYLVGKKVSYKTNSSKDFIHI